MLTKEASLATVFTADRRSQKAASTDDTANHSEPDLQELKRRYCVTLSDPDAEVTIDNVRQIPA
jgi:hypothetical protein